MLLKLEVTQRCNACCVFCTHSDESGDMDLGLAKAAVDLREWDEVQPQFFGEPTLWPHLGELCDYITAKGIRCCFYTNGSNPIPTVVDEVIFSIDTDDHDESRRLRGLDLSRIIRHVDDYDGPKAVRCTVTDENRDHIERIRAFWQARVDRVVLVEEKPIARERCGTYRAVKCDRPETQVVVKHDGTVVGCCLDWHAHYPMGHILDGYEVTPTAMCRGCLFGWSPSPEQD